ncbi:zinc-dependent metalloprotease [Psychroserpens ponticola]|uniref:T9SS type A sorting domain-containing protein n=1 Tax=Psychroserpens ponticola TaxID=2932268 RepID=A0ABY7S163_9FLAO|nr:T9SS type A sorting domain-containing protein [Psychroserpens ponticola]WCO02661.1 T9SS type A sorting domain-containing protein [Psychroserpens ponticola]
MKKVKLLKNAIITVVFLNLFVFSNAQVEPQCGTIVSPESQAYFEQLLPQIQQFEEEFNQIALSRSSTAISSVPIKAHIIRTDAGTGGLLLNQFNAAMSIMNDFYANAYIEFFLCDGINYIDDTNLFNFETDEQDAMTATHNVNNVINIYFANTVTSSSSGNGLCGYAYFPGGPEVILMNNSCATNGSTLSHEMGHFFALSHTHGNINGTLTSELVDGSNCSTTGDFICDTPADPQLSNSNVTTVCTYVGNDIDANNQFFNPDPFNIMSYSRKDCRIQFSPQQYARIYGTYQASRSALTCPSFNIDIASDYISSCDANPTVNFTDNSIGATSWLWDINGDDNIDYTTQNPSHTYASNGVYDVTLTVSNGSESITKVFQNYISVGGIDINTNQIILTLSTDDFPEDISWSLKNTAGTVLYSNPTYSNSTDNLQVFTEFFDVVVNECYTFEINDSFGDGICCGSGNGYYSLETAEGNVFAVGGAYNDGETTYMSNNVLSVDDYFSNNDLSIYPNPATTTLNIKLSNTNNLPDSFSIYNMLGQIVKTESISQISDLTINVADFSDGMYFIKLKKDSNTITIQFVKN